MGNIKRKSQNVKRNEKKRGGDVSSLSQGPAWKAAPDFVLKQGVRFPSCQWMCAVAGT